MTQENRRYIQGASLRAGRSAAGDDALIVEGRALAYNVLSEKGVPGPDAFERIAPGAFSESLASGRDVVALFNHNHDAPLGRLRNKSLELSDRGDGLYFKIRLNPDVVAHRDLHTLVKDGTIGECSFAFGNITDEWSNQEDGRGKKFPLRTIKRAELFDVSLVTRPAYGGTATFATARSYDLRTVGDPEVAALRARLAQQATEIAADRVVLAEERELRERLLELKCKLFRGCDHFVQFTDESGNVDFRPATDEEIDARNLRRAAKQARSIQPYDLPAAANAAVSHDSADLGPVDGESFAIDDKVMLKDDSARGVIKGISGGVLMVDTGRSNYDFWPAGKARRI